MRLIQVVMLILTFNLLTKCAEEKKRDALPPCSSDAGYALRTERDYRPVSERELDWTSYSGKINLPSTLNHSDLNLIYELRDSSGRLIAEVDREKIGYYNEQSDDLEWRDDVIHKCGSYQITTDTREARNMPSLPPQFLVEFSYTKETSVYDKSQLLFNLRLARLNLDYSPMLSLVLGVDNNNDKTLNDFEASTPSIEIDRVDTVFEEFHFLDQTQLTVGYDFEGNLHSDLIDEGASLCNLTPEQHLFKIVCEKVKNGTVFDINGCQTMLCSENPYEIVSEVLGKEEDPNLNK